MSSKKDSPSAVEPHTADAGAGAPTKKDHGVLYLGIDLGTSRTSVCSSNGIRETAFAGEVQRDHRELQRRAALQQQHLAAVGDPEHLVDQFDRGVVDRLVVAAAMRDLEQRHADADPVVRVCVRAKLTHRLGGTLEHRSREDRGAS
jgi:hypothetical protein